MNTKIEKTEEKDEVAGSEKEQSERKANDITEIKKKEIFKFGHVDVSL